MSNGSRDKSGWIIPKSSENTSVVLESSAAEDVAKTCGLRGKLERRYTKRIFLSYIGTSGDKSLHR